jgi:uncharacterized delta-60 repeat protein
MKKLHLVRTIILAGSLLLQLNTLCFQSRGAAGDVDLSFDPGSGVNGEVADVVVQSDGKVIIGGQFTTVKGLARHGIARLNADGSGDSSFNPVTIPGNSIGSLAVQPDGKVLVGSYSFDPGCGDFGCYGYFLDRLNADGIADGSFNPTVDGDVFSFALQSDGKILISGSFTTINGTSRNEIARLNANGSLDTSFDPGTGADDVVYAFALQADGKVIIGGHFATVNGTFHGVITRLNPNGSLDSSFNPGTGPNAIVDSVVLQPDGKILLHGYFSKVNGTNRKRIARLNANGTLDGSFNPDTGPIDPYGVHYVAAPSGGKVIIWGDTNVNGTNRLRILRFLENGRADSSFNPVAGVNFYLGKVASQSDGKVFIGGNFTTVNGTDRRNIARLNTDGTLDGSFQSGANISGLHTSLALQPDGKVLLGDAFTFINGTNRYGKIRLNADGSSDGSFVSDTFPSDLGTLYTGFIAGDPLVAPPVRQPDGKMIFGGAYIEMQCDDGGCAPYHSLSFVNRFNANGSFDLNFEPMKVDGWFGYYSVLGLAVQPDGKIIVGGTFYSPYLTNGSGLARLNTNGTLDDSFAPATGQGAVVWSVAAQPDGKVLIAGNFNGAFPRGIVRLNANGSFDNTFNSIIVEPSYDPDYFHPIHLLALQPDGKVLIGGSFTSINGTNRNGIARLNPNGSLDSSFNPGTGADGLVRSILLQPDGKVLIGGNFTAVNGVARPYIARLYGDAVVLPSVNIARSNAFVIVSWPVTGLNFQLQEATNLALPNSWSPVAQSAVTNAGQVSVTVPTIAPRKFFRLKSQ